MKGALVATDKKLTHEEIRRACGAGNGQMEMLCPGGCGHSHFQLFGKDDFGCKNGCDPNMLGMKLHNLIDCVETYQPAPPAETKPKKPKASELPDWAGFTLKEYCALRRLDARLLEYLFGARTVTRRDKPVAAWAYFDEAGKLLATMIRLSSDSHDT